MPLDTPAALRLVRDFAPAELLVDALGWKPCPGRLPATAAAAADDARLVPLAERDGRLALHHRTPLGGAFPSYAERRAIRERALRAHADVLIVFTDALHTVQLWQWV
ncbi:MAG TPA: hypothetical protein VFX29_02170, partial [Longimicrobiaceae bacterium]|nr:hypothetical protein [Longimicrobiaceae bacterium]